MENNFSLLSCETMGHTLEKDVVEIMHILQNELEKREYKAVVLGLVKNIHANDILQLY